MRKHGQQKIFCRSLRHSFRYHEDYMSIRVDIYKNVYTIVYLFCENGFLRAISLRRQSMRCELLGGLSENKNILPFFFFFTSLLM